MPLSNQNKQPRIKNNPTTPKEAILKARDLIVLASTLSQSCDEQSKLLDLLEIFREYTEKGKLTTASNIITSQITHLESATRKIETQAKALTKAPLPINTPTTKSTYAAITKEGEWNLVGKGKTIRSSPIDKKIEITQRRLILIKPEITNITSFSPISIRNQINEAFQKTGIKGPVIAGVTLSLNRNIIITTNAPFTSQLLLEKKAIWSNLIKFERIQKDQEWHKVIIHKIPIKEFSGTRGMDLILEEIKTFNPEFKPIGTPFWLTPSSKRAHQREGAIVIAFATKSEAELAIRKRLYIAGTSTRVEKFYESKPTTQCQKCQGFGHQDTHCRRDPSCGLCGGKHITSLAIELNIDLIMIQEPWIIKNGIDYSNSRSIIHSNFIQTLPRFDSNFRPRTLLYTSKTLQATINLAPDSPIDPDIQIFNCQNGDKTFQIINIYNEADQAKEKGFTIERCLYDISITQETILLGDFNAHHPWWDPFSKKSGNADQLAEWFEDQNLILLNEPGISTFYRTNLLNPSVLDLTLASEGISPQIHNWQTLSDTGSDHAGILFELKGKEDLNALNSESITRFNTKLANWENFESILKLESLYSPTFSILDSITSTEEDSLNFLKERDNSHSILDQAASELTRIIQKATERCIPKVVSIKRAKPWWSPELKNLRKELGKAKQSIESNRENPNLKEEYRIARNKYFQAIKTAKKDHWNDFLEKEDTQTVFKAMTYTKDFQDQRIPDISSESSFEGKCSAFRSTLFPPPPTTLKPQWVGYKQSKKWEWPNLSQIELSNACSAKIQGKTPGPDGITQEIITKAYKAIPQIFFTLFSKLLNLGYHPKCWKQATGAILKKASKPDYSLPKAYRVIALLNCLGKISERILAQRLGYLAETTHLLHKSQIGGRQKKSAIDAALLLTTEIERNKQANKKTSILFMDIKGAFDHVSKNRLLDICKKLRLPTNLISWIASFLQQRQLKLSFNNQIESFKPISTGIPQGSPISPILFLIYIRDLFLSNSIKFLSYIDDIALITNSSTWKKNIKSLERATKQIYELSSKNAIQFDLAKTELMHFSSSKLTKNYPIKLPNSEIIIPQSLIRWLGIWFDPSLKFNQHVNIRITQAKGAFHRMARLANIEKGLSPKALRQLYIACVTSIADYASVIWWRGQAHFKDMMQSLQNLALRKILGVFKTAPIPPMEVEAGLKPSKIRLDSNIRQYAFRLAKLSPNHPINIEKASLIQYQANLDAISTPRRKRYKPTQLDKIKESINQDFNPSSLEKIIHFNFPPWKRETPFRVNISNSSKEDAAILHNIVFKHRDKDTTYIYTDASSTEKGIGIGVGIVAIQSNNRILYQERSNIGTNQLVYNGELFGVTRAIEYASSIAYTGQKFKIYSDNQAGLYRLKTPSDHPGQANQIRAIKAAEVIRAKGAEISLNWVPGHTSVEGNELADKLAKEATTIQPTSNETSFGLLAVFMENRFQNQATKRNYSKYC
ncbi:hypothetical protein SS1G_00507 [Sclerotinia sclerotiorum 1980 UF-70]|uniref:Reverse transcriptase n=1 Tax=Sclerotinia sclerotiorum (strain ATCC 18683 / 1980 / Ss-1) TaxID=665079 RepID=A7E5D2_SCLS1|nr:hypothetical protein SS1G_00507 [Sclerotinia sclerotiorum 1980 UF-70]EDN91104.1 hypothetical protein SS1G_00507 [Sclerotinia sclerotiorum 1980 UF-70]